MIKHEAIIPNFSSRLVDLKTRVTGVGSGLVDKDNQIHLEWANPTTIGQQIEKLIIETDNSLHRDYVQPELAEKAGVGLRFLRELEQGKETLRLDKVNQVLQLFGYETGPIKLEPLLSNMQQLKNEKG